MNNFDYQSTLTVEKATELATTTNSKFIGGGTSLVDLLRENIEYPELVIDVSRLSQTIYGLSEDTIHVDAAVPNSMLAGNELIRNRFPALAEAIVAGASGQIRNMATVAGNMMQRTRCLYFYDDAAKCNKRSPGTGCDALEGMNRGHAILGTSNSCIATHPSDMCVALAASDATVLVESSSGKREIAFIDFHKLPGDTPNIETVLLPGELITAVRIKTDRACENSLYRKVRDRSSYAFAVVSVAAGIEIVDGLVKTVRFAMGGVAHKPWRAAALEASLQGQEPTDENFAIALQQELQHARGFGHNDFKIQLARQVGLGVLQDLRNGATK